MGPVHNVSGTLENYSCVIGLFVHAGHLYERADGSLQLAVVTNSKLNQLEMNRNRDHAGGNNGLKKLLKDVKVYGGVKDKVNELHTSYKAP
ncbi:unnamed protein product [Sphagnum jensenii]